MEAKNPKIIDLFSAIIDGFIKLFKLMPLLKKSLKI